MTKRFLYVSCDDHRSRRTENVFLFKTMNDVFVENFYERCFRRNLFSIIK